MNKKNNLSSSTILQKEEKKPTKEHRNRQNSNATTLNEKKSYIYCTLKFDFKLIPTNYRQLIRINKHP